MPDPDFQSIVDHPLYSTFQRAIERDVAERVQRSMIEEARSLITARRTSEQVYAIHQTTRRLLTAVTRVVPHADAIVPEEMCK